jgi:hypothetical protein
MKSKSVPAFVKILETDSLRDIAMIKSVLDAERVRYFIQGENMKFIRPVVDIAKLMVSEEDAQKVVELLKPLKLNYLCIQFGHASQR